MPGQQERDWSVLLNKPLRTSDDDLVEIRRPSQAWHPTRKMNGNVIVNVTRDVYPILQIDVVTNIPRENRKVGRFYFGS